MKDQRIKEYCEAEFQNMAAVLDELLRVVEPGKSNYTTVEIAAISTFLHNYYNGVENILKRVLSHNSTVISSLPPEVYQA